MHVVSGCTDTTCFESRFALTGNSSTTPSRVEGVVLRCVAVEARMMMMMNQDEEALQEEAQEAEEDDWDGSAVAVWRERERRQRTIRLLLMFLIMLLLMEDNKESNIRLSTLDDDKKNSRLQLEPDVFAARQRQERNIRRICSNHPRYNHLVSLNFGVDVDNLIRGNLGDKETVEKTVFRYRGDPVDKEEQLEKTVFHYPWNATGMYQGVWEIDSSPPLAASTSPPKNYVPDPKTATQLESDALQSLLQRHESVGVILLPGTERLVMRNDNNLTSAKWDQLRTDTKNEILDVDDVTTVQLSSSTYRSLVAGGTGTNIPLTHDSGRALLQLFARPIPSMQEISLVDGFVKLFEPSRPGFSARKDVLLRVRGVLVHAIGKMSLVSSSDVSRSALVLSPDESAHQRRRLEEAVNAATLNSDNTGLTKQVRDDVLAAHGQDEFGHYKDSLSEHSKRHEQWQPIVGHETGLREQYLAENPVQPGQSRELHTSTASATDVDASNEVANTIKPTPKVSESASASSTWSDSVLPYPFVMDDAKETLRRTKTPVDRKLPAREQPLELNSAGCNFEVNLDVDVVEWTIGDWQKLMKRKSNEKLALNPNDSPTDTTAARIEDTSVILSLRGSNKMNAPVEDEALIVSLNGTLQSINCGFSATVNVTAQRRDWEATTSKAINYSFMMMLVCLSQILVLLRQLLHSQGQSAATRVSLLCLGWQTLLDALLCLAHIYMSMTLPPLFSAFASVSFFKFLIFCVIEMKYMAIIIQARNSNNGGQTVDGLRRQLAMLHLRFYSIMAGSFFLLLYIGDTYRVFYILALYSFWVPQIVLNIITEAKNPMHTSYIYGMAFSRLVVPVYVFAARDNFLNEVFQDSPHDPFMAAVIVLWVAVQSFVLIGQSRYGARWMIPARFLPPKFDYSRPLPSSMLPPGALEMINEVDESSGSTKEKQEIETKTTPPRGRHSTTTRNRIRGNRSNARMETKTTCTSVGQSRSNPAAPYVSLECSICYDGIDVRRRHDYMLAPCNHLFHRECLVQWMDVKMECPICRTELPAL